MANGFIDAIFSITKSVATIALNGGNKLANATVDTTGEIVTKLVEASYDGVKGIGTGIANDAKAVGEAAKPLADKVGADMKAAQEALQKTAANLQASVAPKPVTPVIAPIVVAH
jgi:23S rRNA maturation-related 3'-5' exoribonuclease YhaM